MPAATTEASEPPITRVGTQPIYEALDSATGTLYVANSGDNTLSMIDTRACNLHHVSGCGRHWPTVPVGPSPFGVIVDAATHTVYATDFTAHEVTLFDATTCNAHVTTGCNRPKLTIHVGAWPSEGIVDPATGVVYVAGAGSTLISAIDGNACSTVRRACTGHQPFSTITAGGGAGSVELNPKTHTVYLVNYGWVNGQRFPGANTLSVIDAATCVHLDPAGCTPVATVNDVGVSPADLAIDPRTDTLYITNTYDFSGQKNGTVSVVDAQMCNAEDTAGCPTLVPTQVTVQADPDEQWFDPATRLVWINNQNSNTESVIDSRRCSAATPSGCQSLKPPTRTTGLSPSAVLADPQVGTVYVVDQNLNAVTLLPEVPNGRIAFAAPVQGSSQLFTINPNGTGLRQITHNSAQVGQYGLSWSPDGRGLLYSVAYPSGPDQMFKSLADGSGATLLSPPCTGNCLGDDDPVYSPDGTKIAFDRAWGPVVNDNATGGGAIFAMNADGSSPAQLTPTMTKTISGFQQAHWSPNGAKIVFVAYAQFVASWVGGNTRGPHYPSAIGIMNADGSGIRLLTPWRLDANSPSWSPDGTRILFDTYHDPITGESANLFTMRPDGSDRVELTHYVGGCPQAFADGWSPDGTQVLFSYFHISPFPTSCPGPGPEIGSLHILNLQSKRIRQLTSLGVSRDDVAAWGRWPG
jgi:DNA-binding beta-propeller fold protein YncE